MQRIELLPNEEQKRQWLQHGVQSTMEIVHILVTHSAVDKSQFHLYASPYHPPFLITGLLINYKILLLLRKLSTKMIWDTKLHNKICTLFLGHLFLILLHKIIYATVAFTATASTWAKRISAPRHHQLFSGFSHKRTISGLSGVSPICDPFGWGTWMFKLLEGKCSWMIYSDIRMIVSRNTSLFATD